MEKVFIRKVTLIQIFQKRLGCPIAEKLTKINRKKNA